MILDDGDFMYKLSTQKWILIREIYFSGIITSLVTRMYRVAKKAISTKIVAKEDIGKSQSLWAVCEAIAPAVSVPIYNYIYLNTFILYPSTFLYFSIILYGICCILVMWVFIFF